MPKYKDSLEIRAEKKFSGLIPKVSSTVENAIDFSLGINFLL